MRQMIEMKPVYKTLAPRRRIAGALGLLLAGSLMLVACGPDQPSSNAVEPVSNLTPQTANTPVVAPASTAVQVAATLIPDYDSAADATWDSATEIPIRFDGAVVTADHPSVTVSDGRVLISAAGTYRLSGTLTDGQIAISTTDEGLVRLILDGVNITNTKGPAIAFEEVDKAIIVLADNTQNSVTDGANYVFPDPTVDEPNAAIFSKGDLTLDGGGALTVQANFNDGIASKDGLVIAIARGSLTVNAEDDGIRGKDYLVIHDGTLNITAKGDGLKADNADDAALGYITINQGTLVIASGGDAVQAETDLLVKGGALTLTSGGGSAVTPTEGVSAKGLKAGANLIVDGGSFTIDASDDAVHTDGSLTINGGEFQLTTADDALLADVSLQINGGSIRISQSYEGIESSVITINDGEINLTSSDDGINVADKTGTAAGIPRRRGGQEMTNYTGSNYLYVNGGHIVVHAGGDGVDVNGAVEMAGGTIIVHGPTVRFNGALDFDAFFKISGGEIVATGSSGMAESPGRLSTQPSLLVFFAEPQPAGTLVHIRTQSGEPVLTFAPDKDYQSLAFSSGKLTLGESYEVYLGGSADGTSANGLYVEAIYTPGTLFQAFTINDMVTTVGTGGNQRMRGPTP